MNSLSLDSCRARQTKLREEMVSQNLDAVLLCEPRYVHRFTGIWMKAHQFAAVLITPDEVILSTPNGTNFAAADKVETYVSNKHSTMVDDRRHAVLAPFASKLSGKVGCDSAVPFDAVSNRADICEILRQMRRAKDADEVALIRRAVFGAEAAYAKAREILAHGVSEIHIYAQMLAAATEAVGEPVGEMGNDFQSGSGGGAPRLRNCEDGELMPLDVSVWVRGYSCDLSRTFAVGKISPAQQEAQSHVAAALDYVEKTARAGASCLQLFKDVDAALNAVRPEWKFGHHLGHGIGTGGHEAPRLNPHWDDTFQVGDVFTAEPGLYGEDLKAGIRIEHNYLVTESGLEKLSHFPIDL